MADGQVDLGTVAAAPARRGRVRSFVANRSSTQRVGFLAAVLILLTAPFGGLESSAEADVEPLALGQKIDIGPFYVTVEKVSQVPDLQPAVSPEEGNRLLVVKVTVTNHSDRAELANLVSGAFGGEGTAGVPWEGRSAPELRIYDVDDAVAVPGSEPVNPGSTYTWALVLQQRADADLDALVLAVYGYTFRADDVQTLDPNLWVVDDVPLAEGHVPVEVQQ